MYTVLSFTLGKCTLIKPLLCLLGRDDLYRVELDNMAGDEMFYSKVSDSFAGPVKEITMDNKSI